MEHVPIHRIDVVFTRNLPVNELEISQMVNNLVGIASSETLYHSFHLWAIRRKRHSLPQKKNA